MKKPFRLVILAPAYVVAFLAAPALADHGTASGQSHTSLEPTFTQEIVGIGPGFFGSAGIPVNQDAPSRAQDKPIIRNNLALRTNPTGGTSDCRSGTGPSEGKLSSSFDRGAASREGSPLAGDTADCASTRSAPPDTTPYVRPIVPEDYAPGGRPAIPPNVQVPLGDRQPREQPPGRSNNGDT